MVTQDFFKMNSMTVSHEVRSQDVAYAWISSQDIPSPDFGASSSSLLNTKGVFVVRMAETPG